jgi:hypothetical protein
MSGLAMSFAHRIGGRVKRRADTGKWEVRWRESGRNRSKSFTLKSDARRFEADVHRARELGRPLDIDRGAETLAAFVGVYWRRYAVPHLEEKTRMDYRGAWVKHVLPRIGWVPTQGCDPFRCR